MGCNDIKTERHENLSPERLILLSLAIANEGREIFQVEYSG